MILDIYLKKILIKKLLHPMFIAALFTIAKTQKQPKCTSTDDRIKKTYINTHRHRHTQTHTHTHTHTHTQRIITWP